MCKNIRLMNFENELIMKSIYCVLSKLIEHQSKAPLKITAKIYYI